MKITFIACFTNSIHFFKELANNLSKKISNLALEERFIPAIEDAPLVCLESAQESDLIFVYLNSDNLEKNLMLEEKLIEVELKTKTRILKIIDVDDYSGIDEEEYLDAKEELSKKYSDLITGVLFNEIEFEPKERDFGL